MSKSDCEHRYSDWTPWSYYGSGLDMRERFCQDCPDSPYEQRKHVHDFSLSVTDPYAPVGSGLTLKLCSACREPRR